MWEETKYYRQVAGEEREGKEGWSAAVGLSVCLCGSVQEDEGGRGGGEVAAIDLEYVLLCCVLVYVQRNWLICGVCFYAPAFQKNGMKGKQSNGAEYARTRERGRERERWMQEGEKPTY